MDPLLIDLVKRLAFGLPFIAIWIAGIIFCIQYRKHSSRETTLLIIAFSIFIIQLIAVHALQAWVMLNMNDHSRTATTAIFSIMQFASTIINVIAWVLVLVGIYQLLQSKNLLQQSK